MWASILSSFLSNKGGGASSFDAQLAQMASADAAAEASRQRNLIIGLVAGVVGFGGLVYLLSRK